MDRMRVNLGDGAEVFEYNGMVYHRYNAKMKVAGDSVKVSFYQNGILSGWTKEKKAAEEEKREYEYDPERRWAQTGNNARRRIYDFVACNLNMHLDHKGKKQSFKFVTLTFREDVKQRDQASRMFNDFIGRLNYFFHKGMSEDFLKYVVVPELQMENNRGVWHFHVLFFNMPFLPVSGEMVDKLISDGRLKRDYDKRDTLFYIWRNGSVDVCKVRFADSYDVAGYVSKYVGKGFDDVYEYAKEEKLLHKKRFMRSTGLLHPKLMIAFLDKKQRQEIYKYFQDHAKRFKGKGGELGKYYDTFLVENEFIGKLFGINFRAPKKHIRKLEALFGEFSYGFA